MPEKFFSFNFNLSNILLLLYFLLDFAGLQKSVNELKDKIANAEKANLLCSSSLNESKSVAADLQKQMNRVERSKSSDSSNSNKRQYDEFNEGVDSAAKFDKRSKKRR